MSYELIKEVFKNNCEGYNKWYTMELCKTECSICNKTTVCFEMDGSEGEYFNGQICQDCINKIFDSIKKEN